MLRKFFKLFRRRRVIVTLVQKPTIVLNTMHGFDMGEGTRAIKAPLMTFERNDRGTVTAFHVMRKVDCELAANEVYTFLNN